MDRKTIVKFVVVVLTVLVIPTAWADDSAAIFKRLVQARSLKCTFDVGMQADWRSGNVKTSTISSENMVVHYDAIDVKKGTARSIGSIGAGDINALLTSSHLSFIEKTDSGNLIFTTVFPSYENGAQNFAAVTSRHVAVVGRPFPSQYHGTCQVLE